MKAERMKEAERRLDDAGISYEGLFIFKDEEDSRKAEVLLKDLLEDRKEEPLEEDFTELAEAARRFMEKRKSRTHGLDGAVVTATYEGICLRTESMGAPYAALNREKIPSPGSGIASSSVPDRAADPEHEEVNHERILEQEK